MILSATQVQRRVTYNIELYYPERPANVVILYDSNTDLEAIPNQNTEIYPEWSWDDNVYKVSFEEIILTNKPFLVYINYGLTGEESRLFDEVFSYNQLFDEDGNLDEDSLAHFREDGMGSGEGFFGMRMEMGIENGILWGSPVSTESVLPSIIDRLDLKVYTRSGNPKKDSSGSLAYQVRIEYDYGVSDRVYFHGVPQFEPGEIGVFELSGFYPLANDNGFLNESAFGLYQF